MATRYKDKDAGVVLAFGGQWISWLHTGAAYSAFLIALVVGCALHYRKIVQNEWYGYPEEWFPSVSATIGDRYPERSLFMLLIAITSGTWPLASLAWRELETDGPAQTGPRFALVGLFYLLTAKPGHVLPKVVAISGFVRTMTCGGTTS
jgi:hypothetical protein